MLRSETLQWAGDSIAALWLLWVLIWSVAALHTKRDIQRQSVRSRALYRILATVAAVLLLLGKHTHLGRLLVDAPGASWLYDRFIRLYPGVVLIGAPLVLIGLSIAVWARFYLGGNWSSSVTFKLDHQLVRSGPYRYVRHPIYTGILIAVAGSACATGQVRGLVALVLVFLGLRYKSRLEERLMLEHFGDAYRHYQQEVKGLIPYLF